MQDSILNQDFKHYVTEVNDQHIYEEHLVYIQDNRKKDIEDFVKVQEKIIGDIRQPIEIILGKWHIDY